MNAVEAVDPAAAEHAQFLAQRRTIIGGSDAAAILGIHPYKSDYAVALEKLGRREVDLSDNAAVEWGTRLEDVVAQAYAEKTGRKVMRHGKLRRHVQFPHLGGHIDRKIVGERRLLECKTAGAHMTTEWGPHGSDEVPEYHLVQVQHYLGVTGYEVGDLAVLIGGRDFRIYTIRRDDVLIDTMFRKLNVWWPYIERGEIPPTITTLGAAERWPKSTSRSTFATPEVLAAVTTQRRVAAEIKELEERLDRAKAVVQAHMGDADTLVDDAGKKIATWKSTRSFSESLARELYPAQCAAAMVPSLDTAALKSAIGAKAYDQNLLVAGESRRFALVKESQ